MGIYKNPDAWGAPPEGLYFTIAPYAEVAETKGFTEATRKYAPLVKKNPDGTIANYTEIAGRPFPDPKDGLEAAYNYEFNNRGDSSHYRRYCPNISPKTKTERLSEQEFWEYYFHPPHRDGAHAGSKRQHERLSPGNIQSYVQAARVFEHAHVHGPVHRSVKR